MSDEMPFDYIGRHRSDFAPELLAPQDYYEREAYREHRRERRAVIAESIVVALISQDCNQSLAAKRAVDLARIMDAELAKIDAEDMP
jgi:hypothetical protein